MSEPTRTPDEPGAATWAKRPGAAVAVRIALFVLPVLAGSLAIWLGGAWFWSPDGGLRMLAWFVQALVTGGLVASAVDRQTRRLLPLATLLGISLDFPGQAPSRLSVALEAGSVRNTEQHLSAAVERGLDADPNRATAEAISLLTMRAQHNRLAAGPTEQLTAHADAVAAELGVSEEDRNNLAWSVLLHDIGELCVGAESESHAAAGEAFIAPLGEWLGSWRFAVSQHHERWDGAGYPKGIGGERITLSARIMAIVDAYASLMSKASMTPEQAKAQILSESGTHFDPTVVQAFLAVTPLDEHHTVAAKLPALVLPGVAAHAAQGAAVVVAAAVMALASSAGSGLHGGQELLALTTDQAVEADVPATTSTNEATSAAQDPTGGVPLTSTTERWESVLAELTEGTDPSTTTTTAPETSTTAEPTTTATPTTAPPTTAVSTTIAPPTTAPATTAPPTTAVSTTTAPTTTAPTTTAPPGPIAVDDETFAREDRNKRIDVLANDSIEPGGSPIDDDTLAISEQPAHGTAEVKNGKINYRSDVGFVGEDSLTYRICDSLGTCSTAKVSITVR